MSAATVRVGGIDFAPEELPRGFRPRSVPPATPPAHAGRSRPVPKLLHHKPLGLAYVAYKVRGRRVTVYFGSWDSDEARVEYARFARTWPAPLDAPPPPRPHAQRKVEVGGRVLSLAAAARAAGLKPVTLRYRLDVLGWTAARALSTPAGVGRRPAGKS